ncbi:Protein of unknown function, partial [Cotesia congregata]
MAQHNLIEALKDLVDTIATSYADLLGEQLTDEHHQTCSRVCNDTIEYFNTILLDPGTTIQVRRSVQAHINQLNWFADQFSRLGNQVIGGDLNQGVKWQNLENAFAGNIQTGCVINQRHKDPASFLQVSRDIIINKVQSVLRDLAGLKVNVEFFCTFRKHQQDIEERKSFMTKSRKILPATSLQDWYTEHVYEKLKHVNYTNNLDNIEFVYHFAWIHNLSGLITSQISLGRHKLYFCDRCLNHFKLEK